MKVRQPKYDVGDKIQLMERKGSSFSYLQITEVLMNKCSGGWQVFYKATAVGVRGYEKEIGAGFFTQAISEEVMDSLKEESERMIKEGQKGGDKRV